jgi:NADH:ubiquinone oxidoreductase subunit 5 (subunit L)/multisubunit Na+/H+ antiporter MnhA subunit
MSATALMSACGMLTVACPAAMLLALAAPAFAMRSLSEHAIMRWVKTGVVVGLGSTLLLAALMIGTQTPHVSVDLGKWVDLPEDGFHFTFKLIFDQLSIPFVVLTYLLCGTISAFANSYLHREQGFLRFFVCYAIFLLGMVLAVAAGTIESLFTGWELVGLSSALLVGFFHDRADPVRNALRVWIVYRIADAAFLVAEVVLHHLTGAGDFDRMVGFGVWPGGAVDLTSGQALFAGSLLLVAAAGKSALVPFSGWLPRAMEGPTPSSAIFYGALSVHLGAFLLLRVSPVLQASLLLQVMVVSLGVTTAIYAALTSRVQSDIKSSLAFASLSQVGIIVAEIGLGFHYLPLVHMIGHACLRTLQLLRAPSLLADYRQLENAFGGRYSQAASWSKFVPEPLRRTAYRWAFERGYLDTFLFDWIAQPVLKFFRWQQRREDQWTAWLTGTTSDSATKATGGVTDELA